MSINHRKGFISKELRNKAHRLLRYDMNIPDSIVRKKIFFESRKLFNLSFDFIPYPIALNHEALVYDLTQKMQYFYKAPRQLAISLTNRCNLKCIMCFFHSVEYKKTQKTDFVKKTYSLSSDIVYEAINYAIQNNCEIDFTSPGEVLLDDRIYTFIEYARKNGAKRVGFTSNATLLNRKNSDKLIDSGITYICFSIDGANDATYKRIRGVDLNEVEQNVIYFIESAVRKQADVEINLNCVLLKEVKNEVDMYQKKWEPYFKYMNYISFSKEIFVDDSGFHTENMPKNRYSCGWPFVNMLNIYPNGKVGSCCAMSTTLGRNEVYVGDITKNTLDEIWNSKLMNILRKENLEMKFEHFKICESCIEWANNRVEEDGCGRENGLVLDNR